MSSPPGSVGDAAEDGHFVFRSSAGLPTEAPNEAAHHLLPIAAAQTIGGRKKRELNGTSSRSPSSSALGPATSSRSHSGPNSRTSPATNPLVSAVPTAATTPDPSAAVRLHFSYDSIASAEPTEAKLSDETLLLAREADSLLQQMLAPSLLSSSASSSSADADSPESRSRLYGTFEGRLASFEGGRWPHTSASHPLLSPATLAAWGLFRHVGPSGDCASDCVMCCACSAEMHDWEPADEPEDSHRQAQLSTLMPCPYLEAMDRARDAQYGPTSGRSSVVRSVNPQVDLLLQDIDDEDQLAASDDDLSPLTASSSLPAALARTHSTAERKMIEILESESDKRRPISCTTPSAIQVDGLRVRLARDSSQLQPVVAQARQPLQPFQAIAGGAASILYFQVKIHQLTNTPTTPLDSAAGAPSGSHLASSEEDRAPLLANDGAAGDSSTAASFTSSPPSPLFPPLVIGLTTSSLHAQSLPPGFEPPSGSDLLSVGVTSCGDLNLNGMGPLSGLVARQNASFWPYHPTTHVWKQGDVIGCKVDLEKAVIYFHLNGEQLGPVLLPLPQAPASAPSSSSSSSFSSSPSSTSPMSFKYYPTVSLLHPGDCVELEVGSSAVAFQSGSSAGSLLEAVPQAVSVAGGEGARSLLDSWRLDEDEVMVERALSKLSESRPDLGLVLDQANLARKVETLRASAPVVGGPRDAASPLAKSVLVAAAPSRSVPGPVTISKILPGFSADLAGLRVGDQVRAIDEYCIVLLRDAVSVVTQSAPATVLHFEVLRNGRVFVVPLTLGAKGLDEGAFGPLARWAQFKHRHLDFTGPPVRHALPASTATASQPAPPVYDAKMAAGRPFSGMEHIRALEVSLQIEGRLAKHQAPLSLPHLKTLAARMATFTGHMQAWMQQREMEPAPPAASAASSSSPALLQPPKPLNVAIHGFAHAPLAGFPGRVICFSCGAVISSVQSVRELLDHHRALARQMRTAAATSASSSVVSKFERPPSYHRKAALLPENLETGCLFLTLYDSVCASLSAKAQAKIAAATAEAQRTQPANRSPAALSSLSSSSPPDVVIDMEADDEQALLVASGSSTTPTGSFSGTQPSGKGKRTLGGPIVSNVENIARSSARSTAPTSPAAPPDYQLALEQPSVPVGPAAVHPPAESGIVWQSKRQLDPRQARAGEFTQGSVDLAGRMPLTSVELRARNRGREPPPQSRAQRRWGEGRGGNNHGDNDDGIELVRLPAEAMVDAGPPPPPPTPPMEVLKEFFLGGNPLFLFCKVPLFVLVLPFFLLYELMKALYNGVAWCCEAIERACARCCSACSRYCNKCCDFVTKHVGRCLNFLCCTVLCDGICTPLFEAAAWLCKRIDRHCWAPIVRCMDSLCDLLGRCCSAVCSAIGKCCKAVWSAISSCFSAIWRGLSSCFSWIGRVCCEPIWNCLSACCRAIGNAITRACRAIGDCISACCDAIARGCSACCDAIGRCCSWFWTPICDAIGDCCSAIWQCMSAVCDALYRGIAAVCRAIFSCFSWLGRGVARLCRALGKCINAVVIEPIVWACKKIWACLSACVTFLIVRPAKAIYKYILAPIGRAFKWLANTIADCFKAIGNAVWAAISAIGRAIWAVLSAIGRAIRAVFRAIYDGVLKPIGEAVASAGRAIASLCSN